MKHVFLRRYALIGFIILLFSLQQPLQAIEVLFSPDDHPTERLLTEIADAKKQILVAVYMLTDKKIAEALVAAYQRGLAVELVTDRSSVTSSVGKAPLVTAAGVPVYVFKPGYSKKEKIEKVAKKETHTNKKHHKNHRAGTGATKFFFAPLMHEKFALIDDKLWIGSFNWTLSANRSNQENVLILTDQAVCNTFANRFALLKTRCIRQPLFIAEPAAAVPDKSLAVDLDLSVAQLRTSYFIMVKNSMQELLVSIQKFFDKEAVH